MRNLFILLALLLTTVTGQATIYYVAANGNNSNTGTSPTTPWLNVTQVNSKQNSFTAGDQILFRRGDIFAGVELLITKSGGTNNPITYGAYGSGAKPVISGMTPVTGSWTLIDAAKGIYESPAVSSVVTGNEVRVLTINGQVQQVGRYPNADAANGGYLTFDAFTSTSLTDNSIQLNPSDWVGGEIGFRTRRFGFDFVDLTSVTNPSSGKTTYNFANTDLQHKTGWTNGYGYVLMNTTAALDLFGEWCYIPASKKFRVCFAGNNPSLYNVQVSVVDKLIETKVSNVTLRDLEITGANHYGLYNDWQGTPNQKVVNCIFSNNGWGGLFLKNKSKLVIDSNYFINNLSNALSLGDRDTLVQVSNNELANTGIILSNMRYDDNGRQGDALFYTSVQGIRGMHAYNNYIHGVGYMGLFFIGDTSMIENNFVDSTNLLLDDGGGIYSAGLLRDSATSSGTVRVPIPARGDTVRNNLVTHTIGAPYGAGTGSLTWQGHAYYFDDNSNNIVIINNAGAYSGYDGIYLHNSKNHKVWYNKFYDNHHASMSLVNDAGANAATTTTGLDIQFNQLQAMQSTELLYYIAGTNYNYNTYGTVDNNFLSQPFNTVIASRNNFGSSSCCTTYTLSNWNAAYGFDAHYKGPPAGVKVPYVIRFEKNTSAVDSYVKFCGLYYFGFEGATSNFRYFVHLQPYEASIMYQR